MTDIKGDAMRILLCLLLALVASPAMAEWVRVAETAETNAYIDPATIRRDGNLSQVSELQELKQRGKQGEMSRRVLMEYECKEKRHRLLSLTMHSEPKAEGKVLISVSSASDWNDIVTGTSGATILQILCTK